MSRSKRLLSAALVAVLWDLQPAKAPQVRCTSWTQLREVYAPVVDTIISEYQK